MTAMRTSKTLVILGCALVLWSGARFGALAQLREAGPATARTAVFRADKLADMDAAVTHAIAEHKCPGAVVWLERKGEAYHQAYGQRAVVPGAESMTEETIFDLASLTKAVACAPSIMLLVERGQLRQVVAEQHDP